LVKKCSYAFFSQKILNALLFLPNPLGGLIFFEVVKFIVLWLLGSEVVGLLAVAELDRFALICITLILHPN
jgi:hypothetical protein